MAAFHEEWKPSAIRLPGALGKPRPGLFRLFNWCRQAAMVAVRK
jgi:hypothetical protein